MVFGKKGASMFFVLKNTSCAEQMEVRREAMMVDVRIATLMEDDASPITTTGDSNDRLR